jgi:nucleoside transporter
VLCLFSFTLPKTPPTQDNTQKSSVSDILGLNALGLLKDKNFFIFFISSILICIPLAFYYQNAQPFLQNIGVANPTAKMAIGQMSEALCLLLIPFFFSHYGVKKTILMGMFAWALRYVLFAYGDAGSGTWMLIIGIALHGICYDFFFVAGQIYTDAKAGVKFKGAAQGLITLATYGVGMLIGFWVAGYITDMYTSPEGLDWQSIWIAPAGIAFVIFLMFMLLFKDDKKVAV